MKRNYTEEEMIQIRTLAFIQFKTGTYFIEVFDNYGCIQLLSVWTDETGRFDFDTDREAIDYWGDTFYEFCEKAIEYLNDDTVSIN